MRQLSSYSVYVPLRINFPHFPLPLCITQFCILSVARMSLHRSLTLIIRLEARLQLDIGFTLRRVLAVFTRTTITLPNVNRFG